MGSALCPMCETQPGRWNQPASAERPEEASTEADALERRLCELDSGCVTVAQLHHAMLSMCAMCLEVVADVTGDSDRPELQDRLRYRIARLREVATGPCCDPASLR